MVATFTAPSRKTTLIHELCVAYFSQPLHNEITIITRS